MAAVRHLHVCQGTTSCARPTPQSCPVGFVLTRLICPPQVSLLFDNNGTVLFAMFMAVWGEFHVTYLLFIFLITYNNSSSLNFDISVRIKQTLYPPQACVMQVPVGCLCNARAAKEMQHPHLLVSIIPSHLATGEFNPFMCHL